MADDDDDEPSSKPLRQSEYLEGWPYRVTEEGIEMIEQWTRGGATRGFIARSLGCSRDTLVEIRRRQLEVDDAIARGKAHLETELASIMLKCARSTAANAWIPALALGKIMFGWKEGSEREGGTTVNVQVITLPAAQSEADYLTSLRPSALAISATPTTEPSDE